MKSRFVLLRCTVLPNMVLPHMRYKEGGGNINKEEEKLSWLRQILEWQQDMSDNKEFLTMLKTDLDLFTEQVYCFTPQGDVKLYRQALHRLILLI